MDIKFWVALVLAFGTMFLVFESAALMLGNTGQRKLRVRLAALRDEGLEGTQPASIIRQKYLRRLWPAERSLEELPGMRRLGRLIEQAGYSMPAYRLVAACLLAAIGAAVIAVLLGATALVGAVAAGAALPLPLIKVLSKRRQRITQFEEQLPDALDMMGRALRAGTPLMESLKFVGEEMQGPIAEEFKSTWSLVNYGVSMKDSFADLMERMPCVSLRAMTTAILVQRETGGNLAEILDKIGGVLRARFRFQRRLRTLTAEGRVSALVLLLMPFVLALALSITSPTYLPLLIYDPLGRRLIAGALIMMGLGMLWIRSIIRVRV